MINVLAHRRKKGGKDMILNNQLNVSILFNQSIFKRKLSHVFTNEFVMSIDMKKETRVTQSKLYPRPDDEVAFGVTYPIGWC